MKSKTITKFTTLALMLVFILAGCKSKKYFEIVSATETASPPLPKLTSTLTPSPTPVPSSTPALTLTPTQTEIPSPSPTPSATSTPAGELITLNNLEQVQILGSWEFERTNLAHAPFIAWAPDSTRFAIQTPHEIVEYEVNTLTMTDQMEFTKVVAGLAYAPDGKTLLTSAPERLIEYSQQIVQVKQSPPCDGYGDVAVSPDGNFIVSKTHFSGNLYLSLWTYPEYTCWGNLFQNSDYPSFQQMVFSTHNGLFAATAGPGVKIWDLAKKEEICEIIGYGGVMAFDTNGMLGLGSWEDFSLWDPITCENVLRLDNLFWKSEIIQSISWSPDGSMLVFANHAGKNRVRLHFWDVALGEMKTMWEIDSKIIDQLIFSPNGHYFITSSQEGYREAPARVTLWGIK